MEVAFVYVPGKRDWRVRRSGLEHRLAWLASLPGITERGG